MLQITLSLPGKTKTSNPKVMNLDGVVVREHAVKKDGKVQHYDIAVFFNTLLPKERKTISDYIDRRAKELEKASR